MNPPLDPLPLLISLIRHQSISAVSNVAITEAVAETLASLDFDVCRCDYTDEYGVCKANLVATRLPRTSDAYSSDSINRPGVAYFAHTDVVPVEMWDGPGGPFEPTVVDGRVYGRGSCDMKGSLAAMIVAASMVAQDQQTAPIRIICTADEEVGFFGAKNLVQSCPDYKQLVKSQPLAIIGEPTRCRVVHAHKGIEGFKFTSTGRAAHSSSRDGVNANIAMIPMLNELLRLYHLCETETSLQDHRFDPPSLTWNFGVSDHCTAVNITPGRSDAWVSFRTMPDVDVSGIVESMTAKANELGLTCKHYKGGPPMWIDADNPAIRTLCNLAACETPETVCYATDGGEFTELNNRVVCGPGDIAQAHTSNEWIGLDQLNAGIELYYKALRQWCVQ